ncbi:RTA1 like protein-domain-containing protein [Boeremia exigua]|uniref:RTA1 like protein-domain-containing protein n=1 Tax=Boeremia exigua TaxID=749465 RepID=UPI001E8DDEFF|nr:RTA1 like protein-domain-containing protein [Boeremia exigua]KAH6643617.1 RTA1 like protein-domain-containing protein [Boeremia exigua]
MAEASLLATRDDRSAIQEFRSLCSYDTCPLEMSYWGYRPSLVANLAFLLLFGLSTLAYIGQGFLNKAWLGFTIAMVCGCALEVVGYVGRVLAWFDGFTENPFLIQIICLTIAPAFLAAGVYLCLSRIVSTFGTENSRIKPLSYPRIFIPCDIASLVLQALGGGIASAKTHQNENPTLGNNIMIAGLAFQVLTLFIFIVLALDFATRTIGRIRKLGQNALDPRHAKLRDSWQFKGFIIALSFATLCIFTRCVYRVAELSEGWNGHLIKTQRYFIGLEGAVIIVAVLSLNIFHPGLCFKGALDTGTEAKGKSKKTWYGKRSSESTAYRSGNARKRLTTCLCMILVCLSNGSTKPCGWLQSFLACLCESQTVLQPKIGGLAHLRTFAPSLNSVPNALDHFGAPPKSASYPLQQCLTYEESHSTSLATTPTTVRHTNMNQAEDVEVILGHKRRYKFHSGTLARNSTLFAEMLCERNAARLSSRAKNAGVKIRWMIELTELPNERNPAGYLDLVELTPTGERADGRTGIVVNENGRVPLADQAFQNYESILYAFYNKELTIDDADMSAALSDCYQLLHISDYLGCTGLISKPIEVALFKHGQDLFRAIQGVPYAWIEMANRIRSEMIFKECIIHLVGDWKNLKTNANITERLREVPTSRALVEKYHRALSDKAKALELGILSHYPQALRLPSEDLPIKRESYAKDILVWMALTFFRHWVSQRLVTGHGRDASDCGYDLYSALGAGGDAYMDKSVINQFHTRFPVTKKGMNVLENHLFEIKECIKKVVDDSKILRSQSQLDVNRFPVKYLTCTEFAREDYPWLKEDREARVAPPKRAYKPGGNEIARQNLETTKRYQRSPSAEGQDEVEYDDEEEMVPQHESQNKRMRYESL